MSTLLIRGSLVKYYNPREANRWPVRPWRRVGSVPSLLHQRQVTNSPLLERTQPHNRRSGQGFVAACAGRLRRRRLRKGHGVLLLATESTGALSPTLVWLLRQLARSATLPEGCDTTAYGSSRGSPRAFFPHHTHTAAISAAIAGADAHAVLTDAASRNLADSMIGLPPQQRAHV